MNFSPLKIGLSSVVLFLAVAGFMRGQSRPEQVKDLLERPALNPGQTRFELDQYLIRRVPQLPQLSSPEAWAEEAERTRRHLLEEVIFHGWPRDWVNAPPEFQDMGTISGGPGYRMRKLRYEILPGFFSTAILYEPEGIQGKAPAILNVNGHVGAPGKSVEYKQKRCINYAKRGIFALNLEWFFFGELAHPENEHWYGAHLDLVGSNAVGLFYLAMRKGLDYLEQHPQIDRQRLGVTGLSGGGWQTIVLSALDERVRVAIPVAGYSSLVSRIERPGDIGDIEQNPADFLVGQDYSHLTAMRAPRPTLLIYNNDDNCCFRAPLVRPHIFAAVRPFFERLGVGQAFEWYENLDPGDHNYQRDNRIQSYRFFEKHFGLPGTSEEFPVDSEIKSYEELAVGLPAQNLTILGLARELAQGIERDSLPRPSGEADRWNSNLRSRLTRLIRYRDRRVRHPWGIDNTKGGGIESETYRFEFDDQLSAAGVWLKAIAASPDAPVTLLLSDGGRQKGAVACSDRLNRGEQVLAVDLIFHGEAAPERATGYTQLLSSVGERPLGIQVSQLIALTQWICERAGAGQVRLEVTGIRNQVTALAGAALYPNLFSTVVLHDGMESLEHLLSAPVKYQEAPELFCLDLFKEFDISSFVELAKPAIVQLEPAEAPSGALGPEKADAPGGTQGLN